MNTHIKLKFYFFLHYCQNEITLHTRLQTELCVEETKNVEYLYYDSTETFLHYINSYIFFQYTISFLKTNDENNENNEKEQKQER